MDLFSQIYIGDLGNDATRYELEDAFTPFGTVKNVWIAKRPPGELEHLNFYTFLPMLISYGNVYQVLPSF